MSAKPKKSRSATKKQAEAKSAEVVRHEVDKPSGHVPKANVISRHGVGTITRAAKGFSMGELSRVSLPANLAGRWGVPTDFRRRSVLERNVEALKKWHTAPYHKAEAAPAATKAEERPVKKRAPRKKRGPTTSGRV